MEAHGVSFGNAPAPGTAPRASGMSYLGNSFNPNSPTYQAASRACRKYAVASPVTPAIAAEVETEQLKYADCMRSHGVANFPDPGTNGGFPIRKSIDENSSIYEHAESACEGLFVLPKPPGSSGSRG